MSLFLETKFGKLYHGDCMELFNIVATSSIDMILCDLPYGITDCAWDKKIPLKPLWAEWARVLKENGAVVLTAQQPFAMELVYSAPRTLRFRYELIWEKSKPLGFLNANRMPLRAHENILVFYRKLPKYFPQMTEGKPYKASNSNRHTTIYRQFGSGVKKDNHGTRHPRSVLRFPQEGQTKHPTEKPQALFEWLIKTYTATGDVVLDNCMGSGTTAAACEATGRRWIGMEQSKEYCEMLQKRLKNTPHE